MLLASETGGPPAHGNARGRRPEAARQGATRGSESVNTEGAVDGAFAPPSGLCCAQSVSLRSAVRFIFHEIAAPDGFAPSSADSESAVLLLDDRAVKVVNPEVVATSPMPD